VQHLQDNNLTFKRPRREIRARYTEETIRVYQAYSLSIAEPAIEAQRFVPPFKMTRMTWIKPSFLWMMYRSGWATKSGQERILAIDILRDGFEWALRNASLSHFDQSVHFSLDFWKHQKESTNVRVQWDPERNCYLDPLDYRTIQIGLSQNAAERYVHEWIQEITDITPSVHRICGLDHELLEFACAEVTDQECPYPVALNILNQIGLTNND
jgi:hypothetical protein